MSPGETLRALAAAGLVVLAAGGALEARAADSEAGAARAPGAQQTNPPQESPMTQQTEAEGTFDVEVTPVAGSGETPGSFPRHALAKTFHGGLAGTSVGEMMSVGGADGSGAYVAIETVQATLGGREGSFALVHRGTMRQGADFRLDVQVVPNSGTGGLAGLAGTMDITITGREHRYVLRYTLPAAP
jgi:hypothetical protein